MSNLCGIAHNSGRAVPDVLGLAPQTVPGTYPRFSDQPNSFMCSLFIFLVAANLLRLRRFDSSCQSFPDRKLCLGTMDSNAPNNLIAGLKQPSGPPNVAIVKGRNREKTPNAIIAQANSLDSL